MSHNIYYNPESCGTGLRLVGQLDETGLEYEFNTMLLLESVVSGYLYWATSRGCSCPTPFEEYQFTSDADNDLQRITPDSYHTFFGDVKGFPCHPDEQEMLLGKAATSKVHV